MNAEIQSKLDHLMKLLAGVGSTFLTAAASRSLGDKANTRNL